MELKELGYNKSIRDNVFERIWQLIGDNYQILPSPVKNVKGNVIVIPDEIYWECDKIVKLNQEGFNQKWTYYRPSILSIKYDLVKTAGCLIYNETWYNKMLSGEVKNKNKIETLIKQNKASVEDVSLYSWNNVDLYKRGIWGIKNLNGKILGLYLELNTDIDIIWNKEKIEQSLWVYEKMNNNGLKYEVVLSVADMVIKNNSITKEDMKTIYDGLCVVLKPEDTYMKRIKGKVEFNF